MNYRIGDQVAQYPRYVIRMETENHGELVGKPGQSLDELVAEHYGQPHGYLPWDGKEWAGLIVEPPRSVTQTRLCEGELRPIAITTRQHVVDWVHSWVQEPAR